MSAAESCQQHVEYVDDERQPSIANGSVRHLEVDHNESSLSGYKSDSRSMAASVRSTTASVRSTAASVRSTSGKQLPQQQQPSLDGDWMEKGNSSDTDVDDMRHRNCDADDDYNGGDCDTLASDVEHGAIQPVPSSASSQRDRYNSTGSFDDRDGTSGQHTPTRDDDAKSASTVVGSSTPASVQQMPATHTAEDVTDRTEVAMLPVGSGEVVFRKRVSVVAADGSLNTVTAVRVQQTAAAAAATAADTSSDAGIDATGAKFYSLPEKHTQPDFSSLVKLAGHIKQDYNMNEVDEEDDDSINDDEVFPIVEISVQGGVCKVRETIGRKSRVNVFTENDVAVVRRGSEETTKGAADADFDVIRHPETSDAMADEDNATRCDDGFDVDEREPGSGRGSMNGGLDHVLSSDDDVALPSAHIDVEAIVMSRNSDGASVEDIESAVRQDSLVGAALDDVQSVPDPDVDRQNDSGSEKSAEEPIDDDIDDAVAMARDVARRRRRDNQRRSQANEEEERMMSELLWKLAMKQLKPNDWKKLAKHWEFTDDHISAIQQQYTGAYLSNPFY